MFRHKGPSRTFRHDLRLATFLSFAAGIVNICGVMALGVLTTNVTGHFAYFAEGFARKTVFSGTHFLLYILAFLSGSFTSNFLTEIFIRKKSTTPHNAAIFVEIAILVGMGLHGTLLPENGIIVSACFLLFAMGLQNSLVTKISNAAVRTTHLTGLFTDLGIELSQLFFYKDKASKEKLVRSIGLRSSIILLFFSGCIAGGFSYKYWGFKTLWIAAATLITSLLYDNLRLRVYRIKKRLKTAGKNDADHS